VILHNLRKFGEEGERERAELCSREHAGWCDEEGDARCQYSEECGYDLADGVGCRRGCESAECGRVVEDYEEGDDDILDGEEKVLSICGKGEAVPRGVGECYGI
jgi:hypothetical protein